MASELESKWLCTSSELSVWRVNWNRNGCVLVVSYGMDGIDMWKERLDGKWRKVVNGSVSKEC